MTDDPLSDAGLAGATRHDEVPPEHRWRAVSLPDYLHDALAAVAACRRREVDDHAAEAVAAYLTEVQGRRGFLSAEAEAMATAAVARYHEDERRRREEALAEFVRLGEEMEAAGVLDP